MVKIDCLIFGYRKLKIAPEDISLLTSIFIRSSVFSTINNDGTITVRERDFLRIKNILSGRIEFSYSEPLGLYGKWLRCRNKSAIIIGLVISLIISVLLSTIVWDVRVSGNENLSCEEVVDDLSECGFGIGDVWLLKDLSKIETMLLSKNEGIAWVNINRRGVVAYVRVIESNGDGNKREDAKVEYSNIVASVDCVIEEITVKSGVAVVKPGDVVKKGDLLVAGLLPSEFGGGFCHAEASVIGRVSDKVSVEMERNYQKNTYVGRKTHSIDIIFFDFSVNIFKIYGNLTKECDIIENVISYTHLDKHKLPFYIIVRYIPQFESTLAEYTDTEIAKLASDRLNLLIEKRLKGCDLLKIKTEGDFTEQGYKISSDLIFLSEVGENVVFKTD